VGGSKDDVYMGVDDGGGIEIGADGVEDSDGDGILVVYR
jgi:hypothetical protein